MRKQAGFTLIELTIALAIFAAAIALISLTFVGLVRTQRVATSDRATIENSRRIIEEIVREVRSSDRVEVCAPGSASGLSATKGDSLFISKSQPEIYYRDAGGRIMKDDTLDNTAQCSDITTKVAGSPITSGGVTSPLGGFDLQLISDTPSGTVLKSTAVQISLKLTAGGTSGTTLKTAAATRGEGVGEEPEEESP